MKKVYFLFLIIFMALVFSTSLFAQAQISPSDIDKAIKAQDDVVAKEQNRLKAEEDKSNLETAQKPFPKVEFEELALPEVTTGNIPSFNIRVIIFEGANHLSDFTQLDLKAPFLNTYMTINDINTLVRNITNKYIEAGYITTRVYIPKQNLKEGVLRLKIIEGIIEEIKGEGLTDLQIFMAFPFMKGGVLNLRTIEQGLDQVNRLNSKYATVKLVPSQKTLGASIVVIQCKDVQNSRILGSIRYDNFSEQRFTAFPNSYDLAKDNLFGILDIWKLNYGQQFQNQHRFNNTLALNLSVPLGFFTLTGSYSVFDYLNLINGTERNFLASGKTQTNKVQLDATVFRNQTAKTNIYTNLIAKDTVSFIEDTKSDVGSRKLVMLSVGMNQSLNTDFGFFSINFFYTQGLRNLGASLDTPGLPTITPKAQFKKLSLDTTWVKMQDFFSLPLKLQSNLVAQYSPSTLYSSERISIGDFYTVRGYPGIYQGDWGFYSRNEVSYAFPNILSSLINLDAIDLIRYITSAQVQMFEAVDGGFVYQTGGTALNGKEGIVYLTSVSAGFRYPTKYLNLEITYSAPLWATANIERYFGGLFYLSGTITL